jgi:hypothetical protein
MAFAHELTDNFNDDATDTTKWVPFGPAVREVNHRLEIRLASNSANTFSGYTSASTYDLRSSEARVEVLHAPWNGEVELRATTGSSPDTGDFVAVTISRGRTIFAYRRVGGVRVFVYHGRMDLEAHRWIRLVEQRGTMYYQSSADGKDWIELFREPTPFDVSAIKLMIFAGTYGTSSGGIVTPDPSPGVAVFDNFNTPDTSLARRVEERRRSARDIRVEAAELAAARRHNDHVNNNDEVNYPDRLLAGNYSKSLKHDAVGDPDPGSYATLLRALQSEDPGDFDEIILASPTAIKLTNPQAGLAFDVEGPDAQELTQHPAPRFDSEETAHEAGELYWMAVARDVYFGNYESDPVIAAAINSLNGEFPQFGGKVPVTAQNVFRGIYRGEQVGPYVSQFLLKGNNDPRKPDGLGRDANEGFISYGARVIDQRLVPAAAGVDYLTTFSAWLNAQNGVDSRGQDQFDTARRFIRNLRDGATFVHFDQVVDAFYNAAWILMSEPTGNQLAFQAGITGRPMIDLEFAKDQGNPYDPPGTAMDSRTQAGFATFGPIHLLQVLSETLGRALRAVWWQKWGVHRRLRPEEFGGRVDNWIVGRRDYPIHPSIKNSLTTGSLAPYYGQLGERFPSYLLPQAYPEGAPTHPAYGAGHATGSGALATMLKAFFDESAPVENPVLASADGLSLVAYTGADAGQMTVGGELNKLAGNISLFRNAAGVHWRSDYTESVRLGEAVAIRMLQEMSLGFNEDDAFFELTRFDGYPVRIFDGRLVPVFP